MRPSVAVLMSPRLRRRLIPAHSWKALHEWADVRSPGEDTNADPQSWSAAALFDAATEACLTGWDTPPITTQDLSNAPTLRVIAHTGGSLRHLLPSDTFGRGIAVTHASPVLADAVAEYTVMAMLVGLRRMTEFDTALRRGASWAELSEAAPGRLLRDQRVGIVGASNVGRRVIELLRGIGCPVSVYDPYLSAADAVELNVHLARDLQELLRRSEVLTVHAPLMPSTEGMIGRRELAALPDGAVLVNSARAGLIEEPALLDEVRTGRLFSVLDVFWAEPLPVDSEWRSLPGVVLTPHNAALTVETLHEQGTAMIDEVRRYLSGDALRHRVLPDRFQLMA